MKRNLSARLKAAFLLIIFSMNMVIGFACSVGIDKWVKSGVHKGIKMLTDAAGHDHLDESDKPGNDKSKCDKTQCDKSDCGKENCCNDHVIKFSRVDKSHPNSFAGINTIFFITLITAFYEINVLPALKASLHTKYFVRGHHPPIPDIRIAIQSFQI